MTPSKVSPASPIPRAASLFQLEALTNSVWEEKEKSTLVEMSVPGEPNLKANSFVLLTYSLLRTNHFPILKGHFQSGTISKHNGQDAVDSFGYPDIKVSSGLDSTW